MNKLLLNPKVQTFLHSQDEHSVHRIALSPSPFEGVSSSDLATQLSARSKARSKLPILYHTKGIVYPKALSVEQCSSEFTARYKADIIGQGRAAADITGGFGVDTMFISRGFDEFDYFEINEELCRIAENNFSALGFNNINIDIADGAASVISSDKHYDVIFADPARRDSNASRVYSIEDCTPDISVLREKLLTHCDRLVVKLSPMLDLTAALLSLKTVGELHVVSHRNEVKELLFIIRADAPQKTTITVCDIAADGFVRIFTGQSDLSSLQITFSKPLRYIYDASAAMRKSSLADSYAAGLGLKKLARMTMLYTSDELVDDFQGRVFEVVGDFDKKNSKKLLPAQKASVISKNYPLSAAELARKLKVKDGGEDFLIAFGDCEQKNRVLLCQKIVSKL